MKLVGVSYQTHPLVPSIGSSIQCRPDGPPSDFPPSIAASTSSLDNDMLYEPSFAMVSFTRLVMCSRTSWAPSFLKSFESCRNTFHQFITGKCLCGLCTIMEKKGVTSSATIEKEWEGNSFFRTRLTNTCDPGYETKKKKYLNQKFRRSKKVLYVCFSISKELHILTRVDK